jgi:hypothetical protein
MLLRNQLFESINARKETPHTNQDSEEFQINSSVHRNPIN